MQEQSKNLFKASDTILSVEQIDELLYQVVQVAKLAEQTESISIKGSEVRIAGLVDSFVGELK